MRIETARLYLRPYREADLFDLIGVLGDSETMNFYPQPYSELQVKTIIRRNIENYERHGYGLFAVIEKATDTLVGDCGITVQNIDGQKEFEIGYRICKAKWGLGYAPEAADAMKDYGFGTLGLEKLCSYMASDHFQSRRVAEKIGMKVEKEYRNPRNRDFPTTVYSIHDRVDRNVDIPHGVSVPDLPSRHPESDSSADRAGSGPGEYKPE